MSNVLNAVRDGYLAAVGWVDRHPHLTLWLAAAALAGVLVLA
jgi:hypothetical protein